MENTIVPNENSLDGIAIIGVAGRFPKAPNINQFWDNLIKGTDCIDTFTIDSTVNPEISDLALSNKKFVPRGGRINYPEMFDASFFGYNPREAGLIDPQHRIFLECGWEAMEDSGYNVSELKCSVGVFASCGMNHYFSQNIIANPSVSKNSNEIQVVLGNDKDFLTTRLSYKLNLRGPSFDIQTACSSSLVAVHVACQNLLTYQCDMALAGGVFLQIPWWKGYILTDGDIRSPDGICRPFDKSANGTVFGEGAGIVVLKRLQDAISDHDNIYAVIRGSAVNNDGALKAGYTSPSVEGQSEVISLALNYAGVNASEISFIETHGTGTSIGDPIEIAALNEVFRKYTNKTNYCAIGAVKASIGHLDAASGIAGLIKTALALHFKKIPPTINFETPNPLLKLDETPFFVNNKLIDWYSLPGQKRFAGVSSLGVGGTNAHVILEEAPELKRVDSSRTIHFFPLSSKSPEALKAATENLTVFLNKTHTIPLADCASTLQNGRQLFTHRTFIISETSDNKLSLFKNHSDSLSLTKTPKSQKIVFMFSGQGSQYINMGGDLYSKEPSFKKAFDCCSEIVSSISDINLCDIVYQPSDMSNSSEILKQTRITQPLLFSFEYALVKLWENYGVIPDAMIGHSIGEYVAACVAGVFSLKDALFLVCERGRIMQTQPHGAMLSINMSETELAGMLDSNMEIAVVNTPSMCVVAGSHGHLEMLCKKLTNLKIDCRPVNTSHAFHSFMMQDAVNTFTPLIKEVSKSLPSIPFISNITGNYFNNDALSDDAYWGRHLRQTVRFYDGVKKLMDDGYRIFLETGPGNTLVSFVNSSFPEWKKDHNNSNENILTVTSVRHFRQKQNDIIHFLNSIGKLWQHDININFSAFYKDENRFKASLPTYPFERKRFWIDPVLKIETCIGIPGNPVTSVFTDKNDKNNKDTVEKADEKENFDLDSIVSSIWKDLLGLETVEPEKNFFELGGDSIWASKLLSRIHDKINIDVPLNILYKAPSLNEFIFEINRLKQTSITDTKSVPLRSNQESGLPLSSSQLRLWFLNKLEPDSPAYNLATEFDIEGQFKKDCAIRAIDSIVERHDVFRTTFEENANGPCIHIHKRLNFKFESLDLSNSVFNIDILTNEIRTRSVKPYNLSTGPLLRILLITLNENHHILSVMTHHIISDGWSMGVFLKDFSHLYNCFLNLTEPSLPLLAYRFADYGKWQREKTAKIDSESMEYWNKVLCGPLPVLELPSFKSRPPLLSYEGSAISFTLNKVTSHKLESLSKNEHTTLFTMLLGIFYILLYKYSGHQDIIIGSPVANRSSTDVENLIGFFLNMIPLRINCTKDTSFKQLLEILKKLTKDSFAHQNVPFDRLVEIIGSQRDMNHHPIYQVMFAYQNFPIETAKIGNTIIRPFLVDRGAAEYDISLYMWMEDGLLNGFFEYSTDLFEKQLLENFSSHFINIAESIVDNLHLNIKDVPLLTANDIEQIVYSWNNTDKEYPQNRCIHDLFNDISKQSPLSTAVISEKGTFTYRDLDNMSNRIAHSLLKVGILKGDTVGIYLDRSFEMIAALIGILKTGAAYVPLDPHFPTDRLSFMIEDSGLKTILTQQTLKAVIPSTDKVITVLCIDNDIDYQLSDDESAINQNVSPDSLAYIIYTSGSTGKPKGVSILHRAVVNFLTSMRQKPGIKSSDVVLATTTISFDISVLEIFLPLTTGACTAIISHDLTRDASKLISVITEINPTIIQGTPSLWRMLISAGWKGSEKIKALCGGEPLTADLIRSLTSKVNQLWNMYGPTETTVWSTIFKITDPNAPVLIGFPISNTKTYILDSSMKPVPIGVSGELFIGGLGLAKGYHNRKDLTDKKFVKNPFGAGFLYSTGDSARFRFDGAIDYIGRSDTQVKLRGYRIELSEIENIALNFPNINQCAADCKEFSPGDNRLVLYYTVKPDTSITSSEIRNYLKTFLPDYMIPQHFFEIESIPLSPSGKIDRKSLCVASKTPIIEPTHQSEPHSAEEMYIASIWKKVLGINNITLHDNFYELGGHSLLSINVISQIKNETGFEINPRTLVLNTLEQIAAGISINKPSPICADSKKGFSFLKVISRFFRVKV